MGGDRHASSVVTTGLNVDRFGLLSLHESVNRRHIPLGVPRVVTFFYLELHLRLYLLGVRLAR